MADNAPSGGKNSPSISGRLGGDRPPAKFDRHGRRDRREASGRSAPADCLCGRPDAGGPRWASETSVSSDSHPFVDRVPRRPDPCAGSRENHENLLATDELTRPGSSISTRPTVGTGAPFSVTVFRSCLLAPIRGSTLRAIDRGDLVTRLRPARSGFRRSGCGTGFSGIRRGKRVYFSRGLRGSLPGRGAAPEAPPGDRWYLSNGYRMRPAFTFEKRATASVDARGNKTR